MVGQNSNHIYPILDFSFPPVIYIQDFKGKIGKENCHPQHIYNEIYSISGGILAEKKFEKFKFFLFIKLTVCVCV